MGNPFIQVRYWRGTTQVTGIATTYRGAMRLAARNQNAYGPTFWDRDRELLDNGFGLVYRDSLKEGIEEYFGLA